MSTKNNGLGNHTRINLKFKVDISSTETAKGEKLPTNGFSYEGEMNYELTVENLRYALGAAAQAASEALSKVAEKHGAPVKRSRATRPQKTRPQPGYPAGMHPQL